MSILWLLPTFYGDLKLRADGKETEVEWFKLSPPEKLALRALREKALAGDWCTAKDFPQGEDGAPVPESTIRLAAPLAKVKKIVVGLLKPGREIVSAVRFGDGKMEEVHERTFDTALAKLKDKGGAGVDVAKPTQGCPEPDFAKAELKARGVLEAFLDPQQIADFRSLNRFVVQGADTGHRYMVTSRHNRDALSRYRREVYDLDDRMPYCVHDFGVPAAEEMLAIAIMLQLPGHEAYIRHLH